jgi:hypothetical protein
MFPASEVELPSADKFNAFPPEAQKVILLGFQREQMERHNWLKNQQKNDHQINLHAQRFAFVTQNLGTIMGAAVLIVLIIAGTTMILRGIPTAGASVLIATLGGFIGIALYGHHERTKAAPAPAPKTNQLNPPTPPEK